MNSPSYHSRDAGWKMDSMLSLRGDSRIFLPVFLPFKGVGQLTPYLGAVYHDRAVYDHKLPIPVKTVFTGIKGSVVDLSRGETVSEIKQR